MTCVDGIFSGDIIIPIGKRIIFKKEDEEVIVLKGKTNSYDGTDYDGLTFDGKGRLFLTSATIADSITLKGHIPLEGDLNLEDYGENNSRNGKISIKNANHLIIDTRNIMEYIRLIIAKAINNEFIVDNKTYQIASQSWVDDNYHKASEINSYISTFINPKIE